MYESFGKVATPKAQATACLNNALPDASPPGTTILSLTTLYRPEAWAEVRPQDYVRVKNEAALGLIDDLFGEEFGGPRHLVAALPIPGL